MGISIAPPPSTGGADQAAIDSAIAALKMFGNGLFGDGSDGTVALDGTNTFSFLNKSGSTYTMTRDLLADSLTISSGVTLKTSGYRVLVKNTLTNSGTISGRGTDAGSQAASTNAGGTVSAGGSGGAGSQTNGQAASNVTTAFGGAGGAGGAGASGTAGAGGTNAAPGGFLGGTVAIRRLPAAIDGHTFANASVVQLKAGSGGGGGGGDGTNFGGGGGAGGLYVPVAARIFDNTNGVIHSDGSNGFTPTTGNCGGGGGGGGGTVAVATTQNNGTGTLRAAAGTAGSGVGTGAAGTNGSAGQTFLLVFA